MKYGAGVVLVPVGYDENQRNENINGSLYGEIIAIKTGKEGEGNKKTKMSVKRIIKNYFSFVRFYQFTRRSSTCRL